MKEYKVDGHVSSFLPSDRDWKLVWHDEFDGSALDESKWDYRLYIMGKRHVTWQRSGVYLDGKSNAVFTVFEKDGIICSAQLQTGYNYMDEPATEDSTFDGGLTWPIGHLKKNKFEKKYGYFECRCKLQTKEGWWSAFWLQSSIIGSSLNPEMSGIENDIMESFSPGKIVRHCNHTNGYGVDHICIEHGHDRDIEVGQYHTFGLRWDENGYVFYIDGEESGRSKKGDPVSKIPQFILLTTEVNGYRKAEHKASEEAKLAIGDKFIVDYVRVFD